VTGATPGRLEIEVKIPAASLDAVRDRLKASGARALAPAHFEANDLYDDEIGGLAARGCVLRLRRTDRGATLTWKGPSRIEEGAKRREERETGVSDPDEAERILHGLGLRRRFRYEKRREEWLLEECTIALDETPIGRFVEVEGDPTAIRRALRRLELDFTESLPYTYAELWSRRRKEDPSLPTDMVFEQAAPN
jgi:adenylate cyclase, class 2